MPRISVVIPTYNRAELLRRTLDELTRQTLPADEFEVIVSDDGSSDHTREVVDSFGGRLHTGYHVQEDLGFRAGAARNAGARLATAPVLAFLDTGTLPGPDFLRGHLVEQAPDLPRGKAVVGYVYGYRFSEAVPGLAEAIKEQSPATVRDSYGDAEFFQDIRHTEFARTDFDLTRRAVPFMLFWSGNCSVRADEFWRAGGFDEGFTGWGMEDMDLGFRLHRENIPFALTRAAWAIEWPAERDDTSNQQSNLANVRHFMRKHNYCEPVLELIPVLLKQNLFVELEDYYQKVLDVTRSTREIDVHDELKQAVTRFPDGARVAVFGSGGRIPASFPDAILLDFDRELLARAGVDGRHESHHNIGLRTPLADGSVDVVVITSRLAELCRLWGEEITEEARRIGRTVIRLGASGG